MGYRDKFGPPQYSSGPSEGSDRDRYDILFGPFLMQYHLRSDFEITLKIP